ncbi:MAG: ABC transporter substrate-binding protein [Minisyncoccota bacterium]
MLSRSKKQYGVVLLTLISIFLLSGCGFKSRTPETYQVDLEVWGVFDDSDAYTQIFSEYQKLNPYVGKIQYRKLPLETYKEDLLNALASGTGPDIFMIRNSWRAPFEDKIVPAPTTLITEKQFHDTFVDVAGTDFINQGQVYGLPLSVDSLGLYYNKDLFNAAGIAGPPKTWTDLIETARQLTKIDNFGNITQSGIALGTAYNINRSTDVLTVLMLQMNAGISKSQTGRFQLLDQNSQRALDFYTQFAYSGSSSYAWNPRLHYSIDAFYEGTVGMMINYSWHAATLKQKNAKLNFAVAPLPQFLDTAPVNTANYWGFVVAKNKDLPQNETQQTPAKAVLQDPVKKNMLRVHEAWQLLGYLTLPHSEKQVMLQNGLTGNTALFPLTLDPAKRYLELTKKPAARRDLIEEQKNDLLLAPFALGNLIAKNWYQGNPEAVEAILAEMIDAVNIGIKTSYDALMIAEQRINVLQ